MYEKLDTIIESLSAEMIETLKKWVQIPSLKAEGKPGAPFGDEVRKMLDAIAN